MDSSSIEKRLLYLLLCCVIYVLTGSGNAAASLDDKISESGSWYSALDMEWGGHLRMRGGVSDVGDDSIFSPVGTGNYWDTSIDFRLKNKIFMGDHYYFETHYELLVSGGDTRRKTRKLERLFSTLTPFGSLSGNQMNDEKRLMDLTKTLDEEEGHIVYHRLDRFFPARDDSSHSSFPDTGFLLGTYSS